jgi:lysophospholipase L1-like esterase
MIRRDETWSQSNPHEPQADGRLVGLDQPRRLRAAKPQGICSARRTDGGLDLQEASVRNFVRAASVVASAAVVLGLSAAPAYAASPGYVALGDSYAAGTGTRSTLNDGTTCQRSVYAYPSLVAGRRGYALNFRACSGARIADVANLQLSAVGATTSYVTVTVGGNDAGFAHVLTTCAMPAWASDCNAAVDQAQGIVATQVPSRLSSLFAQLRARARSARVVVTGYPRIFNGQDCNAFTWFSSAEEARLNSTADQLNGVLSKAATHAGFAFTNPAPAFLGHAVCDDAEWLNGLSSPTSESYHPNRAGHAAGFAPDVTTKLTGAPSPLTRPVKSATAAVISAVIDPKRLEAQQRRYAAQDRTIRPEVFRLPDLNSQPVRRAAARAGVDLGSQASIDAADERYAAAQARTRR